MNISEFLSCRSPFRIQITLQPSKGGKHTY